jgi:hypothetical protein
MYGFPAHKLGYQNSSPLEAVVIGLAGDPTASNTVRYLNANQFQFSAGAPTYSFAGPVSSSPLQLGFQKGDQLLLTGPAGANQGKYFTFTDPSTLTVKETITSDAVDYEFLAIRRVLNGVLTQTGQAWLRDLCTWSSIGSPDVAITTARLRWIGVGSGGFPMIPGVLTMDQGVEVTTGNYMTELEDPPTFPTVQSVRVRREFTTSEISISTPVLVSEAGLFVDQNPTLSLDPTDNNNPPVLYKSFSGLMKSSDFSLVIEWDLKF